MVTRNWRAEVETAQAYRDLAAREQDEKRKGILLRMAEAEERHAQRWEEKLEDLGAERRFQRYDSSPAESLVEQDRRSRYRHSPNGSGRRTAGGEFRDQADRALAGEEDVRDFCEQSALEEKAHARVLSAMAPPSVRAPRSTRSLSANAGTDGAAVGWPMQFMAPTMGWARSSELCRAWPARPTTSSITSLISGLAGMLASTLSMGAGAYLAAKSEAEVYEAEISRERAEVEENPEEEIEEMSLFYQLQGFSLEESQRMAERLAEQPEQFVQAMAQSELGLSEHRFPNPWTSAFSAAISTAIGAFVPIIPFFFMGGLLR